MCSSFVESLIMSRSPFERSCQSRLYQMAADSEAWMHRWIEECERSIHRAAKVRLGSAISTASDLLQRSTLHVVLNQILTLLTRPHCGLAISRARRAAMPFRTNTLQRYAKKRLTAR